MDHAKIDRLHATLAARLFSAGIEEEATHQEALIAAMHLFSHLVAAYVYDRDRPREAMRSEIEAHIYDGKLDPMSNVVESAISILRRKIGLHNQAPLIHTRHGLGYMLKAGSE